MQKRVKVTAEFVVQGSEAEIRSMQNDSAKEMKSWLYEEVEFNGAMLIKVDDNDDFVSWEFSDV